MLLLRNFSFDREFLSGHLEHDLNLSKNRLVYIVNRYPSPCSMPSLSVNGTKKKVVGFVDQLSPERYSPMGADLLAKPSDDSNEA